MLALSRRSPLAERPVGPVGIVFLLIGAFVMLAPFYFMFVFATQPRSEIFSVPPPLWFGDYFWHNLEFLTTKIPLWKNLWECFAKPQRKGWC